MSEDCPHESWDGAEGPVETLGRFPLLWICPGCGTFGVNQGEDIVPVRRNANIKGVILDSYPDRAPTTPPTGDEET